MRFFIIGLIISVFSSLSYGQWTQSTTPRNNAEPSSKTNTLDTNRNAKDLDKPKSVKVYWAKQPVQVWPVPAKINEKGIPLELPPKDQFLAIQTQEGPKWIYIHPSDRPAVMEYLKDASKEGSAPYLWLGEQISDISVGEELKQHNKMVDKSAAEAARIRQEANNNLQQWVKEQQKK